MTLVERIQRLLKTRPMERVCLPNYGSSLYLLRDRGLASTTILLFARFLTEAIETWEYDVKVEEATLTQTADGVFTYKVVLTDNQEIKGSLWQ